ncbi:hypothetical protein HJC23_009332 [Cyclotella cryptica]|uniref:Secreted protein n=1 Tax=Cyclotella cryptica TaxID=29204 RepID=A0ABD3QT74_9STRA|eukprot:CCRYP_002319-RA/>CCRYP_002319-RA protein AED:0.14 eAED:0.14 QI:0/-1/0/1/-1/1/1/0/518
MKIVAAFLFSLSLLSLGPWAALGEAGGSCTHGKLYLFDNTTSTVHIIDISEGMLENLTVETTVELPDESAGGLVVYGSPSDPLLVQYRGGEPLFDGFVRVIDTGFSFENGQVSYAAPSIVENANIDDCHRPVHQVHHESRIAIFCDGAFDAEPQINTTIHVIDETKFGSGSESAVVQSVTLPGTHHGVAIPVDDGHLLHSIALDDRVNRVSEASSLPSTFQVIDLEGNVLHELSNISNPDTHCAGFHGSAAMNNTFALACDDVHGGIVIVEFDPVASAFTSRAVLYPDETKFDGFRVGSLAYHEKNSHFVGSYALSEGTEFHLLSFTPATKVLDESNLLTLPGEARECAYNFEVGSGEHVYVFMPNGVLHVFEITNGIFSQVAEQEIVPGMTACSEGVFVPGIQQAFVAVPATSTLYAIDLSHVGHGGSMKVYESTLPFTPVGMTVSGFTLDAACQEYDHDHEDTEGHDHDHEDTEGHDHDHEDNEVTGRTSSNESTSGAGKVSTIDVVVMVALVFSI